MMAENSSNLAINVILWYVLSVLVIIVSDDVIVAAQPYDFANEGRSVGEVRKKTALRVNCNEFSLYKVKKQK